MGFPGEEEEDFQELVSFIERVKFDRLGVFTYSKEENTKAYSMNGQVSESLKIDRYNRLMMKQQKISEEKLRDKISNQLDILLEEKLEDGLYVGRSYMDAPDVDGLVYLSSSKDLEIGKFYRAEITDSTEYDLQGVVL